MRGLMRVVAVSGILLITVAGAGAKPAPSPAYFSVDRVSVLFVVGFNWDGRARMPPIGWVG